MSYSCPDCGGAVPDDAQCSDRFWEAQAIEAGNPDYYAVHQFSVAAYYLQHNLYSRSGWLAVRKLIGEFLFEGLTPQYARQKYRDDFDGGNRTESITRGPRLVEVATVKWTFTMADVRVDSAAQYCADVREWAERVFKDSAAMVAGLESNSPV